MAQILVVDDHEDSREILQQQLTHAGHVARAVENGPRALEVLAAEPCDLVLLDVMMPGMTGLEVLKRIRAERTPAELPVIMVTARSETEQVVEALGAGADDYVVKPVDLPVVLARIDAHLRARVTAPAPRPGKAAARSRALPPPEPVRAGTILGGRYRLEAPLGQGSHGSVWKARHIALDHGVAVKILPVDTATPETLARFRSEGVAACRVSHPNAVTILDFDITAGGLAYLAMELLTGHPLSDEMAGGRRLPLERCVEILVPVAAALAEAHKSGIVHRDIKPANIYLHRATWGEVPKVLDFGIARMLGQVGAIGRATQPGWVVGTPGYMAPERFGDEEVDGKADVYSLGVMLFQMLSGRLPFDGPDPAAVARMHIEAPPPPLLAPGLVPGMDALVQRALRKRPLERSAVAELATELTRLAATSPNGARAALPAPASARPRS